MIGLPFLAVAAVAERRQRAVASFVVAAGDVVEHGVAAREMPRRELLFDAFLAGQQPVQRPVEIVFVGVFDAQLLSQRGVAPQPRGGQFRAGVQQPLDDHGHDEVALARGFGGQQAFEAELAERTENSFNVAVGAGAFDQESFGGGHKGFAGERAADDVDEGIGQVGEIAEGFVFDLLAGAKGAAEQVGGIDFVFVAASSGGYMNRAGSRWHKAIIAYMEQQVQKKVTS